MSPDRPDVLIVQVGTPPEELRIPHGDLPAWFARALDRPLESIRVVRVFEGESLPPPDAGCVAIITGSWSMVTDGHAWSEATAEWVRDAMAVEMPLFGVCYGHQLMAHALGGRVDYHPDGREIGHQTIRLSAEAATDPLLADVPPEFGAHLTHMQTVAELPAGVRVLAASDHDPYQILRYGPRAVSVQFHPEFTPEISRAIIRYREEALRAEGRDPDALSEAVREATWPVQLLRRFVESARGDRAGTAKAA